MVTGPWFSVNGDAVAREGEPVSAGTEMKFGDWEVCEVGSEFIDRGFDFLKLGRGRRDRIVDKGRSIGDRRQILGGHGVVAVAEGFIRRKRILTVICGYAVWVRYAADDDCASNV
jgi:hypothetical protein